MSGLPADAYHLVIREIPEEELNYISRTYMKKGVSIILRDRVERGYTFSYGIVDLPTRTGFVPFCGIYTVDMPTHTGFASF
ncbi:hypothetical protein, partial [Paenibacillus odorifer]|uniref:hypothetical protein n=1 Tax=Paenibacillus odorifer TaxID=189426 RepID=UPI001C3D7933